MNQTLPIFHGGSLYLKLCSLSQKLKYCIAPLLPSCLCYELIFPSSVKCSECPSPLPLRGWENLNRGLQSSQPRENGFRLSTRFYTSTLLQFYTFSQLSCSNQRIRTIIFMQRRLKLLNKVTLIFPGWTLHPYLAISWFIRKNIRII